MSGADTLSVMSWCWIRTELFFLEELEWPEENPEYELQHPPEWK